MLNLLKKILPSTVALIFCLMPFPGVSKAEKRAVSPDAPGTYAFQAGEELTYQISWSSYVSAGTATTRVDQVRMADGREVLVFSCTCRSAGLVDAIYNLNLWARSVYDPVAMQSLTYDLRESYRTKKRRRKLSFDHSRNAVVSRLNDDKPKIFSVPDRVRDILSTFYSIRMIDTFTIGTSSFIETYESEKNWSVEVQALGREKIITPAGVFDTVKVRTYPRYQGEFLNKGEVFLWLTDDSRKIPVLMKTSLTVGSFVVSLSSINTENGMH